MQSTGLLRAAAIGACALLALKVVGFVSDRPREEPSVAIARPGDLPPFMRAIARARQDYVIPDPDVTGSVQAKDAKDAGKDAGKANGKANGKPDAKAQTAQAINDLNKAGVFEGQTQRTPAERALLERLGERREELDSRSRDIDTREKLLEHAEKKIEGRINDLRLLEDKLGDTVQKRDKAEAQGLKNLVTMYETMKPKDAARVFDRLPHEVLIPVVQSMNPRKMAEVLASMSPDAAEKLTVALAARAKAAGLRLEGGTEGSALPAGELPAIDPNAGRAAPRSN